MAQGACKVEQAKKEKRRKTVMDIRFAMNKAGAKRQQLMEYAARLTGIGDDFWEEHILNGVHTLQYPFKRC
jgi:hypothetical protein